MQWHGTRGRAGGECGEMWPSSPALFAAAFNPADCHVPAHFGLLRLRPPTRQRKCCDCRCEPSHCHHLHPSARQEIATVMTSAAATHGPKMRMALEGWTRSGGECARLSSRIVGPSPFYPVDVAVEGFLDRKRRPANARSWRCGASEA